MRTVYLDSDYICHLEQKTGYTPYDTDVFDGKCNSYIEGYRIVPKNAVWMRSDGKEFHGLMITPAVPYETLLIYQQQYEEDNANMVPLDEVGELIEFIYQDDLEVIG